MGFVDEDRVRLIAIWAPAAFVAYIVLTAIYNLTSPSCQISWPAVMAHFARSLDNLPVTWPHRL